MIGDVDVIRNRIVSKYGKKVKFSVFGDEFLTGNLDIQVSLINNEDEPIWVWQKQYMGYPRYDWQVFWNRFDEAIRQLDIKAAEIKRAEEVKERQRRESQTAIGHREADIEAEESEVDPIYALMTVMDNYW